MARPQDQGLPPGDLDRAFEHLDVSSENRPGLLRAVIQLRASLVGEKLEAPELSALGPRELEALATHPVAEMSARLHSIRNRRGS